MEEEEREAAVELELLMHTGRTAGTGRVLGGPVNAVNKRSYPNLSNINPKCNQSIT